MATLDSGNGQLVARGESVFFKMTYTEKKSKIKVGIRSSNGRYSFQNPSAYSGNNPNVSKLYEVPVPYNAPLGEYDVVFDFYPINTSQASDVVEMGTITVREVNDNWELNDTPGNASDISGQEDIYGRISYPAFKQIQDNGTEKNRDPDIDWYKIELTGGDTIDLSIDNNNLYVELYKGASTLLKRIHLNSPLYNYFIERSGLYYIKVYGQSRSYWSDDDYHLYISCQSPQESKNDNTHGRANLVTISEKNKNSYTGAIATAGDIDWYKFFAPIGFVEITLTGAASGLEMYIYSEDSVLNGQALHSGYNQIGYGVHSAGTYYIKVCGLESDKAYQGQYTINFFVESLKDVNVYDSNNKYNKKVVWHTDYEGEGYVKYKSTSSGSFKAVVVDDDAKTDHEATLFNLNLMEEYELYAYTKYAPQTGNYYTIVETDPKVIFYTGDSDEPNQILEDPDYIPYPLPAYTTDNNITGNFHNPNDVDWYKIIVNWPGYLTVGLSAENAPSNFSCKLELAKSIEENGHVTDFKELPNSGTRLWLDSGYYYFRISRTGGFYPLQQYKFTLRFKEDPHGIEELFYGGNGVYSPTGNYGKTYRDLTSRVFGEDFDFSRTYNSRDFVDGCFGRGWNSWLEVCAKPLERMILMSDNKVEHVTDTNVIAVRLPDSTMDLFDKKSGNIFEAQSSHNKLIWENNNYVYISHDQTCYEFIEVGAAGNKVAKLSRVVDAKGRSIVFTRDAGGKVVAIADQAGRNYSLQYTGTGDSLRLLSITDSNSGRQVKYSYNPQNLLAKVTDSAGQINEYEYYNDSTQKNDKYLKSIKEDGKIVETIEYEANYTGKPQIDTGALKIINLTDRFGVKWNYNYQESNKKTIISEVLQGGGGRSREEYYDDKKYLNQIKDEAGNYTIYEYNSANKNKYGEVISIAQNCSGPDPSTGVKILQEWDANGNVTKITNHDGSKRFMTYDSKNNLTSEWDETGKYIYYEYDAAGIDLLRKAVYRQKLSTGATAPGAPTASTAGKYFITVYTYENHNLKTETDPDGYVTKYQYDPSCGNISLVELPGSTVAKPRLNQYEYNPWGMVSKEVSPEARITQYQYNNNGLQTRKTIKGASEDKDSVWFTVYDNLGRKLQEIQPNQFDATNVGANGVYSDENAGQRSVYNPQGLLATLTDDLGNQTVYTYDCYGNVATETNPEGGLWLYTYDKLNRPLTKSFKDLYSDQPSCLEEYQYAIVGGGQVVTQTKWLSASQKLIITEKHDFAGRLAEHKESDGSKTTVTAYTYYGLTEKPLTVTGPRGEVSRYQYEQLVDGCWADTIWSPLAAGAYSLQRQLYTGGGRLHQTITSSERVAENALPASDKSLIVTNQYGPDGYLQQTKDNLNRSTLYQYDLDGNVLEQRLWLEGNRYQTTQFVYNHLGKVSSQKQLIEAVDLVGGDFIALSSAGLLAMETNNEYDKNSNLIKQTKIDACDPNDIAKQVVNSFEYDELNHQISAAIEDVDENGNQAIITNSKTYRYDGLTLSATDGLNYTTHYAYDGLGNLLYEADPKGNIAMAVYDWAGRKVAAVDRNNYTGLVTTANWAAARSLYAQEVAALSSLNRTETIYDSWGRVLEERRIYRDEANQEQIISKKLAYDLVGNILTETDGLNQQTTYTYDWANRRLTLCKPESRKLGHMTTSMTYDALGNILQETSGNGSIKKYIYDLAGRLLQSQVVIDGVAKTIAAKTYDGLNNALTTTDGNGNVTTTCYNLLGNVRSVATPGEESAQAMVTQYYYNGLGNLALTTTGGNKAQRFTYDKRGNLLSTVTCAVDGSQAIATSSRYDQKGNLRFAVDSNGNIMERLYDPIGQVICQRQPETDSQNKLLRVYETLTEYDKTGNMLSSRHQVIRDGNTTLLSKEVSVYDPLGRLLKKWDALGNVVGVYEYNANHLQVKSTDTLGYSTEFAYDQNNRLLKTSLPHLASWEAVYNQKTYDEADNVLTTTDPRGNIVAYTYDPLNRLTKVTQENLGQQLVTQYEYDGNGNKTKQIYADGSRDNWVYNCRNLTKQYLRHGEGPEAGRTEYFTYDSMGRLATKQDFKGQVFAYGYDAHDRQISENCGLVSIAKTYDDNSNLLAVSDSKGTIVMVYDSLNRLLQKTEPNTGTTTYIWDEEEADNCYSCTVTDSLGNATKKLYDQASRLRQVQNSDGQMLADYTYLANGNLQDFVYCGVDLAAYEALEAYTHAELGLKTHQQLGVVVSGQGAKEVYAYDGYNRLASLTNLRLDGSEFAKYTYTYDEAGNQTAKHEFIKGVDKGVTSYTYDGLNRLLEVAEPALDKDGAKTTLYVYDKAGNRAQQTATQNGKIQTTVYGYNADGWLAATTETTDGVSKKVAYAYDQNGNQLSKTFGAGKTSLDKNTLCEYDCFNRLIRFAEGDVITENTYNPFGLRASKKLSGKTVFYAYDGDNVLLEVDQNGQQVAANCWGHKLICRTAGAETMFYWYNGHGDVTALLEPSGKVIGMYTYDAFGVPKECTDQRNNPYRYAGYIYDDESGLYYLRSRFYKAEIGRFIQRDTYAGNQNDPLSLNRYTYCQNEPLMYHDPAGMASVAIKDTYPKGNIQFVKESAHWFYIRLYNKNGYQKTLYQTKFEVWGDTAYYKENKVSIAGLLKDTDNQYLRSELYGSGFRNIKFYEGHTKGNSRITATGPDGKHYIFREGEDYRLHNKQAMVDYNKSGNMVAPPEYKKNVPIVPTEKQIDKASSSYLYYNMGVFQNDKDYGLKHETVEDILRQEVKDNGWKAGKTAVDATIDVVLILTEAKAWQLVGEAVFKGGSKKVVTSTIEKGLIKETTTGKDVILGSNTKSVQKINNQMVQRGWTEKLLRDTVDYPYTTRVSINKATGNSSTVYYTKQGSYVIIDDSTKVVVQVSDNIRPSEWIPDSSIINPYMPK